MVDKYAALVRACTTLEQLFTLASKIAEVFTCQDDELDFFEQLCIEQLNSIQDKELTKEALVAGKLCRPGTKMAEA